VRHTFRPPRLARWLLERVLPDDVREHVSGDLEEMFARRAAAGRLRAIAWYWRQVVSFTLLFQSERFRDRSHPLDMTTGISWIDGKLAARMLVRYPGLTLVSVLGMAVAITISAAAFTIGQQLLDPDVPLEEADRIVALQNWNARTNNRELRSLHDLLTWRDSLEAVQHVGAYRVVSRNLVAPGAQAETVAIAEISAAGFTVARTPAAMGRHLVPDDERAGAPDVVVISDEVWRRRFDADPAILGRQIQLGTALHTIVGVMPPGFAFPVNDDYWIPLRLPASAEPLTGPYLNVFGRLAPGVSLEAAQAELASLGQRTSSASPVTHEHLRPRVMPYTYAFTDMDDPENALALRALQTVIVLLLVLVSVNVAILVYARTATRQAEIAVRSALGASRRRIVGQLFLEALVLAGVAAVIGVGLLAFALGQVDAALAQLALGLPFWMSFEITYRSVAWIVVLTFVAAAIIGIFPALKATGRRVQSGLQGVSAGGGARMQMGRMWTFLIVAQVAVAVAILPATTYYAWDSLRSRAMDQGSLLNEFLTAGVVLDRENDLVRPGGIDASFRARYAQRMSDLERRLEADPSVSAVTWSQAGPGEELAAVIEVEGQPLPADPVNYNIVEGTKQGHLVRFNRVAPDFFGTFEVQLLMGRSPATDAAGVVVNRAFVSRLFDGGNALGHRVRYVGRSREAAEGSIVLGRWVEIVGVVEDFPARRREGEADARLYHVTTAGALYPARVAVRVRGGAPSTFTEGFRGIAAAVDPALQLRNVSSVEQVQQRERGLFRVIGLTMASVTLSVVVLSAAGIYSLMSFTVARRRKEIGIRAALGADPRQILVGIFSRAVAQLGLGAAIGIIGAIGIDGLLEGEAFQNGVVVVPAVAVVTMAIGLLAAYGPAREGLRIQPTEALREE
jgi:putative ABC transport system permease protein